MIAMLVPFSWTVEAADMVLDDRFDETLPAPGPSRVDVETICGRVVTRASRRDTVRVHGQVQADGRVHLEMLGDRLLVSVRHEGSGRNPSLCADLTVELPDKADIGVESVSADISIEGSTGRSRVQTVSGEVTVGAGLQEAKVTTVSGRITVGATQRELEVTSVSGDIVADGVNGRLEAESVSGRVKITGAFERADIESISGDIELLASLTPTAELTIQAHSGDIGLLVPRDVDASFSLETFSGQFQVDGARVDRAGPGSSHRFTRGRGRATVRASTFSGDVVVGSR